MAKSCPIQIKLLFLLKIEIQRLMRRTAARRYGTMILSITFALLSRASETRTGAAVLLNVRINGRLQVG